MIASFQPEIPKLPNGKRILFFILTGFICALIGFWIPKCSSEPIVVNSNPIKATIKKQKLKADSLDKASDKTDSVRIVYVTKWRTLKPKLDSIPCPEALADIIILTDSIITVDSTQISELNAELFVKDLIIANQDTLLKNDSIAIKKLTKKLKWQKVKTKAVAVGMGVLLGLSLIR